MKLYKANTSGKFYFGIVWDGDKNTLLALNELEGYLFICENGSLHLIDGKVIIGLSYKIDINMILIFSFGDNIFYGAYDKDVLEEEGIRATSSSCIRNEKSINETHNKELKSFRDWVKSL